MRLQLASISKLTLFPFICILTVRIWVCFSQKHFTHVWTSCTSVWTCFLLSYQYYCPPASLSLCGNGSLNSDPFYFLHQLIFYSIYFVLFCTYCCILVTAHSGNMLYSSTCMTFFLFKVTFRCCALSFAMKALPRRSLELTSLIWAFVYHKALRRLHRDFVDCGHFCLQSLLLWQLPILYQK